jgi:hypothetical protein
MGRLNDADVRDIVANRISVTPQKIAVMKGLFLKQPLGNTEGMIRSAVREAVGYDRPEHVIIRGIDADVIELQRLGDYFSWTFCAVEAVWGLIHAGILFPSSSSSLVELTTTTQISHHYNGSRASGGDPFDNIGGVRWFPLQLTKTCSDPKDFFLTDPDLYLQSLQPHVPHPEVADALQESVRCFRSELYMASMVMLGKATEGIVIELGTALIDALPLVEQPSQAALRKSLGSISFSLAKKLRDVLHLYESKQSHFKGLSQMKLGDVRLSLVWADSVRDSRNMIHYGNQPNIINTHDKVAAYLLTGSKELRNLYALHAAALANPGT